MRFRPYSNSLKLTCLNMSCTLVGMRLTLFPHNTSLKRISASHMCVLLSTSLKHVSKSHMLGLRGAGLRLAFIDCALTDGKGVGLSCHTQSLSNADPLGLALS